MTKIDKDIVLLGIQGSGKGTQGRILTADHEFVFFEMGAYLRKAVSEGLVDEMEKQYIDESLSTGVLVPDDIIKKLLNDFIVLHKDEKVIFDGVCRTLNQKIDFDKIMKSIGRDYIVIYLELGKDESINRLVGRRICPICKTTYPVSYTLDICTFKNSSGMDCGGVLTKRKDDSSDDAIMKRINNFFEKTIPVVESFSKDGTLLKIDASLPIEQVGDMIRRELLK